VALGRAGELLEARKRLLAQKEKTMSKFVTRFLKNESGATAIEYGLIAALVAVVLVTALTTLGTNLSATLGKVSAKLG
jgi:pilus assembly protein Flp/PilA